MLCTMKANLFATYLCNPGWWTNHPMLNVFVARIAGLGGVVVY